MHADAPSLDALERLAESADVRDRAFAASVLTLRRDAEDADRAGALYERIRETARREHAAVRRGIADGTLDAPRLRALIAAAPEDIRDHLVEEILDIAYPPLDLSPLAPGSVHYCPSALSEILFTIDHANLGADNTFVDLGSGLGKVVLLVALLTGAHAYGVEIDPVLVARARSVARALHIDRADFILGDTLAVPLPRGDVYYMYIPTDRSTDLVGRLRPAFDERRALLFAQALDVERLAWLRDAGPSTDWLHVYTSAREGAMLHPSP